MIRERLVFNAPLISIVMVSILGMFPVESIAFQLTPSSITAAEGVVTSLTVTVERNDWQPTNTDYINKCASEGVANADWVAVMQFHFLDGTAEFGSTQSNGDISLTNSGSPMNDNSRFLRCATGSQPPASSPSWNQFDIVLNEDGIDEGPESATLYMHSVRLGAFPLITDSMPINIEGNIQVPYSDWQVKVTNVLPTALYPDEVISMTAMGDRTTNAEYSGFDGWAVSYLLSTDSDISLADTVLETRSFQDYSINFDETWTGTLDVQPGTYWVGACSTIADDDPSNDCSTGVEITVLGDIPDPDLNVLFFDAGPETVGNGKTLRYHHRYRECRWRNFRLVCTVDVYLTDNNLPGADDILIATLDLPELEPGEVWKYAGNDTHRHRSRRISTACLCRFCYG